ncbi:MAG: 16S rRNA (cytidine(1402)-2'-O)-methyltransferase [Alphaproteobacteria bacterium]|nr:MAG: 16S rRNA (cytidine(1402)-2'-O)-methyltransferase [Alphaproteobacteria bacterium]
MEVPDPQVNLANGLFVVATPIGNLRDVTLRALDVLNGVDLIACEDTRITSRLLTRYGINTPMVAHHEHNAAAVRPRLLGALDAGEKVALVSDAGTPLISDPGYKLVREAAAAGHRIIPVPGASATLAALSAAGVPTDRFLFVGFLPEKQVARQKALRALIGEDATLVIYESARRLPASIKDMAANLPGREVVVARELTKRFEEFVRGDIQEVCDHYQRAGPPKGEVVVLLGPPPVEEVSNASVDAALRAILDDVGVKAASSAVAALTGQPKRDIYARALKLTKSADPANSTDPK